MKQSTPGKIGSRKFKEIVMSNRALIALAIAVAVTTVGGPTAMAAAPNCPHGEAASKHAACTDTPRGARTQLAQGMTEYILIAPKPGKKAGTDNLRAKPRTTKTGRGNDTLNSGFGNDVSSRRRPSKRQAQ